MQFTFTQEQSTSIASVSVNGQEVVIFFQNNPDESYEFVTDNEDLIVEFLQNPGDASIGQQYNQWVEDQILIPSEKLVAV